MFVEGERATTHLPSDVRAQLVQRAATEITGRYHELAADLVSVVCILQHILVKFLFHKWFHVMNASHVWHFLNRLAEQNHPFSKYARGHKGEQGQAWISLIIMCLIPTKYACNCFWIFRYPKLWPTNGEHYINFKSYKRVEVINIDCVLVIPGVCSQSLIPWRWSSRYSSLLFFVAMCCSSW